MYAFFEASFPLLAQLLDRLVGLLFPTSLRIQAFSSCRFLELLVNSVSRIRTLNPQAFLHMWLEN